MSQAIKYEIKCTDCDNVSIVIVLPESPTPCYCPLCSAVVEVDGNE